MKGEQTEEERMNYLQSVTKFLEHIITLNWEQHKYQSTKTRAGGKNENPCYQNIRWIAADCGCCSSFEQL